MHEAFTQYFNGKLGLAPLDDVHPTKILELGAIQAATLFPDAQIVAVDRAAFPADRVLPPNVKFQLVDLTKELEFEAGTFDLVHSRSVVNGEDALRRASRLVKPGGLLLLEEPDVLSFAEFGGPATRQFTYKIKEILDMVGADVEIGRKVEGIVASLGDFSDIQVKKISMPFGANGPDDALNKLGLGMKQSLATASEPLARRFSDRGLTLELVREYNEEQAQKDNKSAMNMYICWARRSVN
ncbi:hypothetical protein K438DRAFT_1748166 [Mycena galopus ATCC 62051]|nr:hypothetical protein K438DRAFT_1748166 [Mycena galopus ATCC 62051]